MVFCSVFCAIAGLVLPYSSSVERRRDKLLVELTHERGLARVQRQDYDIRLQGELDRSAPQHVMTSTDVQANARAEVEKIRSDLAREAIERMDQKTWRCCSSLCYG